MILTDIVKETSTSAGSSLSATSSSPNLLPLLALLALLLVVPLIVYIVWRQRRLPVKPDNDHYDRVHDLVRTPPNSERYVLPVPSDASTFNSGGSSSLSGVPSGIEWETSTAYIPTTLQDGVPTIDSNGAYHRFNSARLVDGSTESPAGQWPLDVRDPNRGVVDNQPPLTEIERKQWISDDGDSSEDGDIVARHKEPVPPLNDDTYIHPGFDDSSHDNEAGAKNNEGVTNPMSSSEVGTYIHTIFDEGQVDIRETPEIEESVT